MIEKLCSGAPAGWSTITRRQHDVAHETGTVFQAFTESFARVHPDGRILQIHGFRRSNRTTDVGKAADAILSNGAAKPSPWLDDVVLCLAREAQINALAYPRDVTELGATTNAQGHLLKALNHSGFLHVELSRQLRRTMIKNEQLIDRMFSCLGHGLR